MAARKSAARSKGARLFIDGMTASCLAAPSGQLPKPEGGTAAWRAGVDGEGAGQAIMLSPDNGGGNAGGALVGVSGAAVHVALGGTEGSSGREFVK